MKTEDALGIIESFKAERPEAYRLALAASLAVRVEPELVRALRLGVVREADAGAEADLWFSPLVQSQTPLALEFDPAVQELLRRALSDDPELLDGAWEVIKSFHEGGPYALRLEEELTWLGLAREDNRALIEERFASALARLRSGREGIARWATRALPSLPPKARTTDAALVLSLAAGMRTGVGPVLEAVPARVPEEGWLSEFTSGTISRVEIGVRLLKNEVASEAPSSGGSGSGSGSGSAPPEPPMKVELSYPPAPGAEVIEVPDTYRLLLEISWEVAGSGRRIRQLSLLPDERRPVAVEYGDVTIRTALGDLFRIRPRFDYDILLLYYPADARWTRSLADRLSEQVRDGEPLRVTTAPFDPSFKPGEELEELKRKFGLSRKVGLVFTDEHIFGGLYAQLVPSRPEPRGRGDWLIWLKHGGDWTPGTTAPIIDFSTQPFEQAFRDLWRAVTGEELPLLQETPTPSRADSVKIYCAYSHKDEHMREQLDVHLSLLRRQGVDIYWSDREIGLGGNWADAIDENLRTADIILLLVSANFISSDYAYDVEMRVALERHEAGEAVVIPVILQPSAWDKTPLGKLQALPSGARPVTKWMNRSEAFDDIARGVRQAAERLLAARRGETPPPAESEMSVPPVIPRPPVVGFVARRDEQGRDVVERLKEELTPDKNQLVVLWGPGGAGKTTLAAEFVRQAGDVYGGRVAWVSALGRAEFGLATLLDEIATQLGADELRKLAPEPKAAQIGALVRTRPTLIVLDNFQTVAPQEQERCLDFLTQRAACPSLITTRERVGRDDASIVALAAMTMDEARDLLGRLVQRTRKPANFDRLDRDDLIRRCEANPLIIQWVVQQIDLAKRPQDVFDDLARGEGDAAERVFTRSFNLPQLGDDGRTTLLALSLFAPDASREALAEVAGFGDDLRRLNHAVERLSGLWLVETTEGNERLLLRGLTRELARARLSKEEGADEMRRLYTIIFLRVARENARQTPEDLERLEAEKGNLLGALEAAYAMRQWGTALNLSRSLDPFLRLRGYWDEAVRSGEIGLEAARALNDTSLVARVKANLAVIHKSRGQYHEARNELQEVLVIFKELGYEEDAAGILRQLAEVGLEMNEFEKAQSLYAESLDISRKLDEPRGIADALFGLGEVARGRWEQEEAQRLYSESLNISRELDDQRGVAAGVNRLAILADSRGETEEARRLYSESLELNRRLGDQYGIAINLQGLGGLAGWRGEATEAQRLFEESLVIYRRLGAQKGVADILHQMSLLAKSQGDREEGLRLAHESLRILERLQSPGTEAVRRTIADLEGQVNMPPSG